MISDFPGMAGRSTAKYGTFKPKAMPPAKVMRTYKKVGKYEERKTIVERPSLFVLGSDFTIVWMAKWLTKQKRPIAMLQKKSMFILNIGISIGL